MPRVLLAVAVLTIVVYGLVDVIRTDRRLTRGISKPAWIVVMVVLPVIGAALWFIFGRPRGNRPAQRTLRHPTAPDDDPEFLRALELRRRNQAEADRLKKLKDQLDAREQKRGDGSGDSHDDAQGNDEVK
ncbi:PLD nuclease N-terminal domain-containing protein [Arthrobacter rhizosphaerae]|uniref:PLD nuclease N-terminal domain-containing protein n=1 Tax=Arthrobacter rhizosphaerae TaxID=2855490 RepID=UPI001FF27186|nr:PLD nuclease N-terminal domain-containing protein [Arthrobacter rhizosphaerae]